jgi:hypothetical protein
MTKTIFIFCSFTMILFLSCVNKKVNREPSKPSQKEIANDSIDPVNAYSQAIADYINAMYEKDKSVFDTLFIGKHVDFPNITLPKTIQKNPVLLLTYEEANKKLSYRRSLVYLNVIGWIDKTRAEFIIVTFFEGGKPQHNCLINYAASEKNELEMESLKFEFPYPGVKK